jgi:hypothetical protein
MKSAGSLRQLHRLSLGLEAGTFLLSVGALLYAARGLLFSGEQLLAHDNALWGYPLFSYFADGLLHGHIPLWNPFSHGGEPLMPAYLQLRLLDPVTFATILTAGFFTEKLVIIFNWCWLTKCLTASLGVQFLMRRWARNPFTRAALAPVVVLSSLTLSSFHQDGYLHQFYSAPFALLFMFRLLEGRTNLCNWLAGCFFLGQSFQSYFFVGTTTAIVCLYLGHLIFRRREALALFADRRNLWRATASAILLGMMAAPTLGIFLKSDDYRFSARNIPAHWPEMLPHGGPIDYDLAPAERAPDSLRIPYGVIELSGTSSRFADALGLLAPPAEFFSLEVASEAHLFYGGLTFLFALVGLFLVKHPMKGPWLLTLFVFGTLMLGPRTPVHWLFFQVYPPLWFERHTHQLASFFGLSLLFFFVIGADRVLTFRTPIFAKSRTYNPIEGFLSEQGLKKMTLVADLAVIAAGICFAVWVKAHGGHSRALVPLSAAFFCMGSREACVAMGFMSRRAALAIFVAIPVIAAGLAILMLSNALFPPVPTGQIPVDWFALPVVSVFVVLAGYYLGGLTILPLVGSLAAIGLVMATAREYYLLWVIVFLAAPAALIFWARDFGRAWRRRITAIVMLASIVTELTVSSTLLIESEFVPRDKVDGSVKNIVGGARFPTTRLAAINEPPYPDESQPVRNAELLKRQGVAFDPPRSYPRENFVDDARHVLTGYRWNGLAFVPSYDRLVHSTLSPEILSSIFAVGAPLFQFKAHARLTDDFLTEFPATPVAIDSVPWSGPMSLQAIGTRKLKLNQDERTGLTYFEMPPEQNLQMRFNVAIDETQLRTYIGRFVRFKLAIRRDDAIWQPMDVQIDDGVSQTTRQSFKLGPEWQHIVTAPHLVPADARQLVIYLDLPAIIQMKRPPVVFVGGLEIATSDRDGPDRPTQAALDTLADVVFLQRNTLSAALSVPVGTSSPVNAKISIDRLDFDDVALTVETAAPGFLYVADAYTPDWRATVNGVPVSILRANEGFKVVPVGAGKSVIRLFYAPRLTIVTLALFYAGIALAMLGWLAGAIVRLLRPPLKS